MSIAFSCPDCGKKYNVPESMAGRKAKCAGCGVMMQIANSVAITERPLSRSRGAAGDETDDWQEEESPRKKHAGQRVVDDDEPDDDEPVRKRRKKRRKPAKKSGAMILVVLATGLVALLGVAGVGGGLAWWYLRPSSVDPLKFAPDNCKLVAVLNMDQIESTRSHEILNRDTNFFKHAFDLPLESEALKKAGVTQILSTTTLGTVAFGPAPVGGSNEQDVDVVTTKNAVSAGELANDKSIGASFTDSKVNGYTLYEGSPLSFCVVSRKQVIFGKAGALRAVLQRDKMPEFSDNLKVAMTKADLSKPGALAVDAAGATSFGPNAREANLLELQWVAVQGVFGADINVTVTTQSRSDRGAKEVKKQIDDLVKTLKSLQSMAGAFGQKVHPFFDDPKTSVSGSTFTAEVTLKADGLAQLKKNQGNANPFNPPGNNPPGGNPGRPKR